ncbi:LCCL domain protein [Aspergillus bombycis]|uniref:LCCL domain protein n=1 Tax=Aspergillus bombycis TaxID=109264 RepID=A0A1F8A3W4_9EURO|nr:LCCL domain protein [Aspergillus bombycis]OGM46383.1 LCCL domain protein [Aspergillus bombycis]
MHSDQTPRGGSRSRSSSPEKRFPVSEEYPMHILAHEDPAGNSPFVIVTRPSTDSVHADDHFQGTDEPLLPTSSPRLRPDQESGRSSCSLSKIYAWIKGPSPPRRYLINPCCANGKPLLVGSWSATFLARALRSNATNCGINGDDCRPFDKGGFAFRCPAGCASTIVLEPYYVGPEEINYKSLVIGGGTESSESNNFGIYRGDSAICPAALHAGLISDQKGGCGVLRRTGEYAGFVSIEKNGIASIGFPSNFPLSFTFGSGETSDEGNVSCQDLRWPLFTFSLVVSAILSLFTTSPAAFYASIYLIVYFQVALSSDPPYSPDFYEVVSTALGRFLPCAFVGFAMYYFCVRHTLKDLDAHWDKTVLWLGPCWVGALNTDTFDKIPISRLTPHDIQQQPGAIPALIIIVTLLIAIVLTQAFAFRNEGRLPRMLSIYGIMVCGIVALLIVPNMNLRIHHYILSLLFLPGTTIQTRPSLLYQGLLVGLFINGIARWGFDSILQTAAALLNGAELGSVLPVIAAPLIPSAQNIIFKFPDIAEDADGISVLVNDVERFQAFKSDNGSVESFNWTRLKVDEPEYFRFGNVKMNALGGLWYEDFTKPVVWEVDGVWNSSGQP